MPRLYENAKINFSSFDEFKEVAAKTLNETFGRVKPFDVIDYSFDETTYRALAYWEGEVLPPEQKEGEQLSTESKDAEDEARKGLEKHKVDAELEAASEKLRLEALIKAGERLSPEDEIIANNLELIRPISDALAAELTAKVKSGHMSFEAAAHFGLKEIDGVPVLEAAKNALRHPNEPVGRVEVSKGIVRINGVTASTAAADLADASGIDISKVEGTGKDGTIKVDDVKDYIANNAPAQENADGNGNEQSNA